jgi:hypothetical protein
MRQQLRFAFANHYTVVQELIQNARRAGATRVCIDHDQTTGTLTVDDDGAGIEDFQTLLTFAASGWSAEVATSERPYGMGFMAAIYAASQVEITSRGKRLVFDTDRLLADEAFRLEATGRFEPGARIILSGVKLDTPAHTMQLIAHGYPIPLIFNGLELQRPDAVDAGGFSRCAVGHTRINDRYNSGSVRAYLQGFKVYERAGWHTEDVVHLDGALFRGKFPDRDRVIDESAMLAAVDAAVKSLYEDKLTRLKATLPAEDFCRQALHLARSLHRLDVFNDIELIPRAWLAPLTELPHSTLDGENLTVDAPDGAVTRAELEASRSLIADIWSNGTFEPLDYDDNEDGAPQRLWTLAYASRTPLLMVDLHADHWVYRLPALDDSTPVDVEGDALATGRVTSNRTHWIGHTALRLCGGTRLRSGSIAADIHDPFATRFDGELTIVVPCTRADDGTIVPTYVSRDTLRQCCSYIDDQEQMDETALDVDEREVNQAIRLLLTKTPRDHLEHLLREALRDYGDELKRFASMTLIVDAAGFVKVQDMVESPATAV